MFYRIYFSIFDPPFSILSLPGHSPIINKVPQQELHFGITQEIFNVVINSILRCVPLVPHSNIIVGVLDKNDTEQRLFSLDVKAGRAIPKTNAFYIELEVPATRFRDYVALNLFEYLPPPSPTTMFPNSQGVLSCAGMLLHIIAERKEDIVKSQDGLIYEVIKKGKKNSITTRDILLDLRNQVLSGDNIKAYIRFIANYKRSLVKKRRRLHRAFHDLPTALSKVLAMLQDITPKMETQAIEIQTHPSPHSVMQVMGCIPCGNNFIVLARYPNYYVLFPTFHEISLKNTVVSSALYEALAPPVLHARSIDTLFKKILNLAPKTKPPKNIISSANELFTTTTTGNARITFNPVPFPPHR